MAAAKKNAIELEKWNTEVAERHSTMTKDEIEAEYEPTPSNPELFFDTSQMAIYGCEGKMRVVLSEHAYIFCRGLEKLGQRTLLAALRIACDEVGISWAEPPPPGPSKARMLPLFPKRKGSAKAE